MRLTAKLFYCLCAAMVPASAAFAQSQSNEAVFYPASATAGGQASFTDKITVLKIALASLTHPAPSSPLKTRSFCQNLLQHLKSDPGAGIVAPIAHVTNWEDPKIAWFQRRCPTIDREFISQFGSWPNPEPVRWSDEIEIYKTSIPHKFMVNIGFLRSDVPMNGVWDGKILLVDTKNCSSKFIESNQGFLPISSLYLPSLQNNPPEISDSMIFLIEENYFYISIDIFLGRKNGKIIFNSSISTIYVTDINHKNHARLMCEFSNSR